MAAYTSTKSGNWSDSTVWGGTPTSADTCTIANTHTVTLDTTGCVCSTLTVNSGGTLTASTTANSSLTTQLGITNNGTLTLDMSSVPQFSCTVLMNNSNNATSQGLTVAGTANFTFKGASKKSFTTVSGAMTAGDLSCIVADATGWVVGDTLVFATTQTFAPTAYSVTASTWSGGYLTCTVSSTTGLVKGCRVAISSMQTNLNATWVVYDVPGGNSFRIAMSDPTVTDGVGTAMLQPKSDVVTIAAITPGSGATATITWSDGVGTGGGVAHDHADACYVGNFSRNVVVGGAAASYRSFVYFATQSAGGYTREVANTLFKNTTGGYTSFPNYGFTLQDTNRIANGIQNCAFYGTGAVGSRIAVVVPMIVTDCSFYIAGIAESGGFNPIQVTNSAFFGTANNAIVTECADAVLTGNVISGYTTALLCGANVLNTLRSSDIWSCSTASVGAYGVWYAAAFDKCTIGTKFGAECSVAISTGTNPFRCTLTDTLVQSANLFSTSSYDFTKLTVINKNGDAGVQEVYTRHSSTVPAIQRNVATINRATSSIEMTMNYSGAVKHSFEVLAKAGETITLKTYVRKNSSYGASTLPSVTVSGLGITPVTSTMSGGTGADTWELLTTSATNSGASDGNLAVTFTAQSATAGAKAFFSGTPVAPFITRARHYGYLFNETIPTVTIDPYVVATEATASGYTGVTITGSTTRTIAFSAGTADTAQKFYDYSRTWCCEDVSREVPFSRAGTLFSITTGWTVIDPTYTGVTWGGGNVRFTSAGTKTGSFDSCDMTFTAAGTYSMGDATFAGTVELINTSGGSVTVELPSGTSYTNTGPNVTVTTPQLYQTVTVSGATAGSRLQIYDTANATELYNGTPTFPYTWTDASPASVSRDIRVRVAYVNGATAKGFIEANIGTCGTTEGTTAVSYLVSQSNDTTYNSNAIDGPAIYATSGITFTDAATDLVNCDIAGGSVTYPTIYACFVYWNFTATGIANDFTYVDAPDTANYLFSGMKIRNTSATDLTVTGGYGRDATSGLSKDIVDTAGSTGNIFLAPDHVVAYATGSGSLTAGDISNIWAAGTRTLTTTIPTAAQISTQVLTDAQSTPIHSDLRKVANATVTGSGTANDPWGPA